MSWPVVILIAAFGSMIIGGAILGGIGGGLLAFGTATLITFAASGELARSDER